LQELVIARSSVRELAERARAHMAGDLRSDALRKVEAGTTSLAEVFRVCGADWEPESEDVEI